MSFASNFVLLNLDVGLAVVPVVELSVLILPVATCLIFHSDNGLFHKDGVQVELASVLLAVLHYYHADRYRQSLVRSHLGLGENLADWLEETG